MSPATLAAVLKEIRAYSATEWELFIEEWIRGLRNRYVSVKRLGMTGDRGRDVAIAIELVSANVMTSGAALIVIEPLLQFEFDLTPWQR
jgi:hypothetical protein